MKKNILHLFLLLSLVLPSFAFAEDATSTASSTEESSVTASSTERALPSKKSFTVCSQEAIERRDSAIAASRTTYNTAMSNALTDRKNQEKAAVALDEPDEKKDAIKLSVDTYKDDVKKAQNDLTLARKIAWQNFDDDVNACRKLEQSQNEPEQPLSKQNPGDVKVEAKMMMAEPASKELKTAEVKTFREAIKEKIENFISLFN